MPVSHQFTADNSAAVIHLFGVVDADEIIDDIKLYHSDVRYRPGLPELAVLDGVVDMRLSFPSTQGLFERMRCLYLRHAPNTKLSIYAPGDLAFGTSRMFQTVAAGGDGLDVGLHRAEADAIGWLGRAETTISDLLN